MLSSGIELAAEEEEGIGFMGSGQREYSLDFIKVAATVLIIFHHYQQVTGVSFEAGVNFYGGTFYFGNVVELFFLLSGYFMHKK